MIEAKVLYTGPDRRRTTYRRRAADAEERAAEARDDRFNDLLQVAVPLIPQLDLLTWKETCEKAVVIAASLIDACHAEVAAKYPEVKP